jgi:hypothetical protein
MSTNRCSIALEVSRPIDWQSILPSGKRVERPQVSAPGPGPGKCRIRDPIENVQDRIGRAESLEARLETALPEYNDLRANHEGLAEQKGSKSVPQEFANSLGVKDFQPIRNSDDGTCF